MPPRVCPVSYLHRKLVSRQRGQGQREGVSFLKKEKETCEKKKGGDGGLRFKGVSLPLFVFLLGTKLQKIRGRWVNKVINVCR